MKIEEAIEILESIFPSKSQIGLGEYDHVAESLDMAIQALETIEKGVVPADWHNDVYETIQKRYIDLLERTRWIPVTERLPDESGTYLIYVEDNWTEDGHEREQITSATWQKIESKWHYGHTWRPRQKPITHWMPLPEPPTE